MKELVVRVKSKLIVEYFEKKISDRLAILAQHKKKDTDSDRGQTCLNRYKPNSDRKWSLRFFLLLLDMWKIWGTQIFQYYPGTTKNTKIKKVYNELMMMKVTFPSRRSYYEYIERKTNPDSNMSVDSSRLSLANARIRNEKVSSSLGNKQTMDDGSLITSNEKMNNPNLVFKEKDFSTAIRSMKKRRNFTVG